MKSANWTMQRFPEILNLTYWAFNFWFKGNDELGKLLGGLFLEILNSQFSLEKDNTLHPSCESVSSTIFLNLFLKENCVKDIIHSCFMQ